MFLNFSTKQNSVGQRNRCWKTALESLFTFTLPVFRTKQGAWHKRIQLNYKLSPTYPQLAISSLRELHQTSPSALRAETSFRYQSDPPENQDIRLDIFERHWYHRNIISTFCFRSLGRSVDHLGHFQCNSFSKFLPATCNLQITPPPPKPKVKKDHLMAGYLLSYVWHVFLEKKKTVYFFK